MTDKINSLELMQAEVNNILNLFIDYGKPDPGFKDAVEELRRTLPPKGCRTNNSRGQAGVGGP